VGIEFNGSAVQSGAQSGVLAICIGDEAYWWGSASLVAAGVIGKSNANTHMVSDDTDEVDLFSAIAFASAINHLSTEYWAMYDSGGTTTIVYVFRRDGGDFNSDLACDLGTGDSATLTAKGLAGVRFRNVEANVWHEAGTNFTLGGEHWGTMKPVQTEGAGGNIIWNVTLNGRDVGDQRDLWIANENEFDTSGISKNIIEGMDRSNFVEIQNAANALWSGAEVRTQSSAQEALDAITNAINTKDKVRADLGALQNRLENSMANLTIQAENLQAAESRISDVDVAAEMTEFTRNNVLAQAATSMLAQANSLSQLALSLLA
jgi:flagellin